MSKQKEDSNRMMTRRLDREKRRKEIALEVAGDLGVEDEEKLRKVFITKQLYGNLLNKRVEVNQDKSSHLQQAFQKIKNTTGMTDVNEIVSKFLARDETYNALKGAAEETQAQIEAMKKENAVLQQNLQDIQVSGIAGQGNRELYKEIDECDLRLAAARKGAESSADRLQQSNLVLKNITNCVIKLLQKVEVGKSVGQGADLQDLLAQLETKVQKMTDQIMAQMGRDDRGGDSVRDKTALAQSVNADDADQMKQFLMSKTGEGDAPLSASTDDDGFAQSSIASGQKATDMLYKSLMSMTPDVTPRNVRIEIADDITFAEGGEFEEGAAGPEEHSEEEEHETEGFTTSRDTLKRSSSELMNRNTKRGHKSPSAKAAAAPKASSGGKSNATPRPPDKPSSHDRPPSKNKARTVKAKKKKT